MRRKPWLRSWAIVWAVLQLALPAAAAYADMLVERDTRAQVAHVESTSSTTCRPLHAAECAFCQVLSHDAMSPAPAPAPAIVGLVRCPASSDRVGTAAERPGGRPPARAPPEG
ncbi:MAG: hypothetical protein JWL60_162 [Gemmatimonadetes bacterium]|nr:hypothetical protein [Gemmatimonadota bacterium]